MILWALPAGVAALAVVALLVAFGRLADEAARAHQAAAALGELRLPLTEVHAEVAAVRTRAKHLGSRYPRPSS